MNFKSDSELNSRIEGLVALLEQLPAEGLASYTSLTKVAGRNVQQQDGRYLLYEAIKRIETVSGTLYACVRGKGIKRLVGDEFPSVGVQGIRSIRKKAKRVGGRLGKTRLNDLSDATQKTLIAQRAQLGTIAGLADNRKTKSFVGQVPAPNLERTGLLREAD